MSRQTCILFGGTTPTEFKEDKTFSLNSFFVEKSLGTGFNSEIVRARHVPSGIRVAIKSYDKKKIDAMQCEQILRECRIHLKLYHTHILNLYSVIEDEKAFHFITEFAEKGDLFSYLRKLPGQRLSESDAVRLVLQPFLSAMGWLHDRGIVHRDIKPENVLLDANLRLMVCDFGLAIDVNRERPITRLGTLAFMSPEVILASDKQTRREREQKATNPYSAAADIWACGVLAFEVLVGSSPFERKNNDDTIRAILRRDVNYPSFLSKDAVDFIESALRQRPEDRPSLAELMSHSFIRAHTRGNAHSQVTSPTGAAAALTSQNSHGRTFSNVLPGEVAAKLSSNELVRAVQTKRYMQTHVRRIEVASPSPSVFTPDVHPNSDPRARDEHTDTVPELPTFAPDAATPTLRNSPLGPRNGSRNGRTSSGAASPVPGPSRLSNSGSRSVAAALAQATEANGICLPQAPNHGALGLAKSEKHLRPAAHVPIRPAQSTGNASGRQQLYAHSPLSSDAVSPPGYVAAVYTTTSANGARVSGSNAISNLADLHGSRVVNAQQMLGNGQQVPVQAQVRYSNNGFVAQPRSNPLEPVREQHGHGHDAVVSPIVGVDQVAVTHVRNSPSLTGAREGARAPAAPAAHSSFFKKLFGRLKA